MTNTAILYSSLVLLVVVAFAYVNSYLHELTFSFINSFVELFTIHNIERKICLLISDYHTTNNFIING